MTKTIAKTIGIIIGKILTIFISVGLLLWCWNKVAVPYFNASILTYWEMFAIRVAFGLLNITITINKDNENDDININKYIIKKEIR